MRPLQHFGRILRSLLILVLLANLSNLIPRSPLWAQEIPRLQITGIDTGNFPEITVTLYGENLNGVTLADLPLVLREDGEVKSVEEGQEQEIGIQVAFVLDASASIRNGGAIDNQPRFQEFQSVIERFIDQNILSSTTDWSAAFTTGQTRNDFRQIQDWTQDHGATRNSVLDYTPPQGDIAFTPLFDLISYVLDEFERSGVPENVNRSIVFFSDGVDENSELIRSDITDRARNMNVRIYTVMVGPEDTGRPGPDLPSPKENLERIASLTNGQYTWLNELAALDDIWSRLEAQRRQFVLRYRTSKVAPRELEVEAPISGQLPLRATRNVRPFTVVPIGINVIEPQNGVIIERTADSYDRPLNEIEPRELPIRIELVKPENDQRRIQRVEYVINDITRVREEEPFDEILFDIAALDRGEYTLRVMVTDEFGLVGRSQPVAVNMNVIIPTPVPTATPLPTFTATPLPSPSPPPTVVPTAVPTPDPQTEENSIILPLLLLLLAILILVWLYRRRKNKAKESSELSDDPSIFIGSNTQEWSEIPSESDPFDDATEIPAAPPFTPVPAAYLIAEHMDPKLPERITLHVGSVIRIGRRADLCDITIDDKRISRAHAIITHKEDGFHIQDDGSKGGTYVNQSRLAVSDDRLLKPGDIVNFHAITYRFELAAEHTEVFEEPIFDRSTSYTPDESFIEDEKTEPIDYRDATQQSD